MSDERRWPCCDQPYGDGTTTCTVSTVEIPGAERDEELPSVRYDPDYGGPDQRCHDCHIRFGGYHHPGCDMERCPKCGGQLISCGCLSDEAYGAWQRMKDAFAASEAAREALVAALREYFESADALRSEYSSGPGWDELMGLTCERWDRLRTLAAQPAAPSPGEASGE